MLRMCRYALMYTGKIPHYAFASDSVIGSHQTTQRTLCHRFVNNLLDQGYCTCGGKHSPPEAVMQTYTLCNLMIHASWFEAKLYNGLILPSSKHR